MRRILHRNADNYEIKMVLDGIKDYHDDIPNEYIIERIKRHINQFTDKKIFIKRDIDTGMPPIFTNPTLFMSKIFSETIYPYHSHDFYEINVIYEGKCIEYINNTPVFLGSGDILIMRPDNVFHSFYAVKGTNAANILVTTDFFKKICAEFEQNFHSFFGEFLKKHNYCVIRSFAAKELHAHTAPIKKMYYNDSIKITTPAENLYAEHQLRLLFLLFVRAVESGKAYYELSDGKKIAAHSVDAVVRYIREHFADITMEKLVKKFGYSERQLLRMIKHHTGNNFKTQVMYHRLQRARQLLESTDLSVKEISEIIGYESSEYFCRLFKRETYRTPLEYRVQMQNSDKKQ